MNETKGRISPGSDELTVRDITGYTELDLIVVRGAGALGGDLYAAVESILGPAFALDKVCATNVSAATVGRLADPTTVTCKALKPDGTLATLVVVKDSVGRYSSSYTPTARGDHFIRWATTGTVLGAGEKQIVVLEQRVV